jgi:hypothetical protein
MIDSGVIALGLIALGVIALDRVMPSVVVCQLSCSG